MRPGRATDHSPLLVPRSWKSRAIPLPTLWACNGITLPFLNQNVTARHWFVARARLEDCQMTFVQRTVVLHCFESKYNSYYCLGARSAI